MKNMVNKLKSVMNNHPKIFVAILLLILIIVIFVIYRIADHYLNYSKIENYNLYTYVGEVKYDFSADVTVNRKGVISKLDPSKNINFDSTPIYGEEKVIFPKGMLIILPEENYSEYRLLPYSYIEKGKIITKDFDSELKNYFVFDGIDTYLFSDAGTINIDGTEVKLSKNSYVICEKNRVTYYDYENDKALTKDFNTSVSYKTNSYVVNLSEDTVGNEGNLLPSSVEYVDFISKYDNLQKVD